MTRAASDILADPFGERAPASATRRLRILGSRVDFTSNSPALLRLVDSAYAGLPRHRLAASAPRLRLSLILTQAAAPKSDALPPTIGMVGGASLLGGATASSTAAILSPREGTALIVVSPDMLRHPYHLRYELIEFAVCTLAARAQRLIPLHAACVARGDTGIVLMGQSGAGKSTLALHCLMRGMEFVAEDAVFATADSLLATGTANFLHVQAESQRWLGARPEGAWVSDSPTITRRSGVEKFEVDLRRPEWTLAPAAPRIGAVVFLSSHDGGRGPLLRRIGTLGLQAKLRSHQPYAAGQPRWTTFVRNLRSREAFVLRRGRHPFDGVDALETWLGERTRSKRA